jgi:outer membrane protein assembly factor BamB
MNGSHRMSLPPVSLAVALAVLVAPVARGAIRPIPQAQAATAASDTAWRQWGGPARDFTVPSADLADSWPAEGPRRLWSRALGEGHSSILVEDGRLYTMYRPLGLLSMIRRSQEARVAAFDAATGQTIWEHTYAAPTGGLDLSQGAGPHSTPLITGDLLFAMSSRLEIMALDKRSGRLVWSHDLASELGAPVDSRGYSPSPIAYGDTVIVPAGGRGSSVVAMNQQTGAIVWKAGDFPLAPGSPLLIDVGGQPQLVVSGANEMVGMDPAGGAILWRHPSRTDFGLNISMPTWGGNNQLLISAAYNNGTRMLTLARDGRATTVHEAWFQNRMRVHMGTIIRFPDFAVGSSGDFGPCPITAIDLATGRILWQSRDFARANFLLADGKLIVLDEDGTLGLATASREGLQVLAKAAVLDHLAWTVPTLAGGTLYLRDRATMMALDLAAPRSPQP